MLDFRSLVAFTFIMLLASVITHAHTLSHLHVYEFGSETLQDNAWGEIPGGFEGLSPGLVEVGTLPSGTFTSSDDDVGLAITVAPGQVSLLYADEATVISDHPALLRMTVRASSPWASVSLIALRGDFSNYIHVDGSLGLNMPADSAEFVERESRMTLLYDPLGAGLFTPALQVAGIGTTADETATVWIDKVEILSVESEEFSSHVNRGPALPTPVPTGTPIPELPTPTPTATPLPITPTPHIDPPPSETITVQLDLPTGATPLDMALIPNGTFTMGSPQEEIERLVSERIWDAYSDEGPQRQVTISQDFYMGKYPVTQAQYEAVMKINPSHYSGYNCPVEQVSWYDAALFCNRLSELHGLTPVYDESDWTADMNANGFRLPTEAEREYAARAGTTTRFYWGEDPNETEIGDYAWDNSWYTSYSDDTSYGDDTPSYEDRTIDVGQKIPNAFGLFDMSGNVWEWCQDWYGDYPNQDQVDPTGLDTGERKVARGGSLFSDPVGCRSAHRTGIHPDLVLIDVGFRVVRTLSDQQTIPTPTPTATPAPPTPTPQLDPPPSETITVQLDLPTGATPLDMALIPNGVFTMGTSEDEQGPYDYEGPQRRVTISQDFYMGKYHVTQAQYLAVMGSNPSFMSGSNRPVMDLSWFSAARFCNRLSERHGFAPVYNESNWTVNNNANGFRLPTEAEWEYACRAGTTTRFYWGEDLDYTDIKNYAWYGNVHGEPQNVGLKLPNAFGLFDMSGNVWEWCQDWYGGYPNQDQVDPLGPSSGGEKVVRGGGWNNFAVNTRSANRSSRDPSWWFLNHIGFRIVRVP